jgi:hypothetical protein
VTRIPGAEYKVVGTERLNDTHRRLRNRHGVKIQFLRSGSISRFVFQNAVIQTITAVGLMSIAGVIVDQLMLRIMPQRLQYIQAKYQVTQDFSDIRDGKTDLESNVNELNRPKSPVRQRGNSPRAKV